MAASNVSGPSTGVPTQPKGNTVRQPELTSLIGLRDSDGDRLILLRLERPNGTRRYMLRVGTGSVILTPRDLDRLSTVIQSEIFAANQFRSFARAIWLLILCALMALLASAVTGPLFAYPWST
jgi:hypothetical protein